MADDQDLRFRAEERGWPTDLLDRALGAFLPMSEVRRLLRPNGPSVRSVERRVEAAERITGGAIRARELTTRDLDAFADLWQASSEVIGEMAVTVERDPNPLAQFRLHEDPSITVLDENGVLLACTSWDTANVLVAGERRTVLISQGMRVRDDRRREGLGDTVRLAPFRALIKECDAQFMYMRAENVGVMNFLKGVGFRADHERPQTSAVVSYLSPPTNAPVYDGVRRGASDDIPACARLINESHLGLDLFRPVTTELLEMRLEGGSWSRVAKSAASHVYGWQDFWVVEEGGEVVACAGLWDRGRDVRERWLAPNGTTNVFSYSALLDIGWAPGSQAQLAQLVEHLAVETGRLGRGALAIPLHEVTACGDALGHIGRRDEHRVLEWTPFSVDCPRELKRAHIDLRYW